MSDLRPEGIPLVIDGVERRILFTLNAVDHIQDRMDMPIDEVIDQLTVPRRAGKACKVILAGLLNDEVERKNHSGENHDLKKYTEEEIGWLVSEMNKYNVIEAILKAYGVSMPEPEEESPNGGSVQQKVTG